MTVERRVARDRPKPRNRFAQRLFTPLPSRYDRLAEILSMGQNGRWRRAMVGPDRRGAGSREGPRSSQEAGAAGGQALVLDVASGTAGVALQLASRTGARVVGVDLTERMLRQGQANVTGAGLGRRIGLVAGEAEQLPFPDASFDALTFTYLLRYVDDPQATLAELARVVKPGGTMASLEFCVPPTAFWRASWVLYTRADPAGRGPAARWAGLAAGGPVPRAEHHRPLPPVSRPVDGRGVAAGRFHRGRDADHEPGRRPGHVGPARQ